jgi:uncharacterized protein
VRGSPLPLRRAPVSFIAMSIRNRAKASAAGWFFRYFGLLLLIAASAAQWSVLAWMVYIGTGVEWSWWVHLSAVALLTACNRALTMPRAGRRSWAFRAYTGVAFVAMFCALFLALSATAFALVHLVVGGLTVHALGPDGQVALDAGMSDAFRWVATFGMAFITLTMGYGYTLGQRALSVTRTPLTVRGLSRPLRIAQISDVHVGQNLTAAQLSRFVESVNRSEPDIICITGDIADSPLADMATFFPILAGLRARFGVFAILGNHDHYTGAERVAAALRRWTPFHVLRDDALTLELEGGRLHIIGLDDRGRDWARGVRSDGQLGELLAAAPEGVPVLLLAHRPDIFHQAAAAGVALTLSGHTHGGQLAIPWFDGRRRNLAEFVTEFNRGLYGAAGSYLYVNCGLGVTGQRIRLWTPREISLLDLSPA